MLLIRVTYNAKMDDCFETVVHRNLTPKDALEKLNQAHYPAYICEPALVNSEAYFLMEVKNQKCLNEYKKIKD